MHLERSAPWLCGLGFLCYMTWNLLPGSGDRPPRPLEFLARAEQVLSAKPAPLLVAHLPDGRSVHWALPPPSLLPDHERPVFFLRQDLVGLRDLAAGTVTLDGAACSMHTQGPNYLGLACAGRAVLVLATSDLDELAGLLGAL